MQVYMVYGCLNKFIIMEKLLLITFSFFVILLCSCSERKEKQSASAITEKCYRSIAENDHEEILSCMYFGENDVEDKARMKDLLILLIDKYSDFIDQKGGIKSVEILEEKPEIGRAHV